MKIDLQVDVAPLLLRLQNGERKLAFAVVNAINKTAVRVQQAEFAHARSVFTIRKTAFMMGTPARPGGALARITPFASVGQGRPYAEISVGAASQASNRRLLLRTFEHGGERKPFTPGAKSVAVPLLGRPARPSISRGVPYEYTFAGMHLTAFFQGKRLTKRRRQGLVDRGLLGEYGRVSLPEGQQSVQWKGRNRTFLLTHSRNAPYGGVFQRIGPGRGDIRMIYAFRRGLRVDARLEFVSTARRVADAWFREELQRQAIDALAHSKASA